MTAKKKPNLLPWLVLAAAYLFAVGFQAVYGMHNLNADNSSEMVLADLLNEEGGFLSTNWFYSTELRVVSPVPVYQLGLLLFDSWHMARTFSIAVLLAGVVASLLYALRGADIGDAGIYAAAALILPFSRVYNYLFLYGGGYTVFFMLTCWLIGLSLRLLSGQKVKRRLLLIGVLSLWGGLNGVRMLMMSGAPLFLACGILAFCRFLRCRSAAEGLGSGEFRMLLGAAVSMAVMAVGYLINVCVLADLYFFKSYQNTQFTGFNADALFGQIEALPAFFGERTRISLFSMAGISSLCAIGLCLLLGMAIVLLYRMRTELTAAQKCIVLFAGVATALGIGLNAVTELGTVEHSVGYYMTGLQMLVVSAFVLLEKMHCGLRQMRSACMVLLTSVFALEAVVTLRSEYNNTPTTIEEAADWLVENGYTQGYTTFWNGNVLTEASDGVLDVYVYNSWVSTGLYDWLQERTHWETTPQGKVFVYISEDDYQPEVMPCKQEDHLVWQSGEGSIYAYDSGEQVEALQRGEGDQTKGEEYE